MQIFYTISYVVLGLLSIAILYSQRRIQAQQFKLALYEKRYPVFLSTMEYISEVCRTAKTTDELLFKFLRSTKDKEFLFGEEVRDYIDVLYKWGLDLRYCIEELGSNLPIGEERSKLVADKENICLWFEQQLERTKEIFRPYLEIKDKPLDFVSWWVKLWRYIVRLYQYFNKKV